MLLFCRHAREGNTTMNVTKHDHRNRRLSLYFYFAKMTKEPFEPRDIAVDLTTTRELFAFCEFPDEIEEYFCLVSSCSLWDTHL